MNLERNIADRELFELIKEEAGPKFYELCAEEHRIVEPETKLPANFGQKKMPFGQFEGRKIDDVPMRYLEYIAGSAKFIRQLNLYLKECDE